MLDWNQIFIGFQICLSLQLMGVSVLNILEGKRQKILLGVFCLLLIQLPILIIGVDYLKENVFIYSIFGVWKGFLYAPLLFLYLKSLNKVVLKLNITKHLIFPVLLCIISVIAFLIYKFGNGDSLTRTFVFHLKSFCYLSYWVLIPFYFVKGLKEYKLHIRTKLKEKPKIRFYNFYLITNVHLFLSEIPSFITYLDMAGDISMISFLNNNFALPYYEYIFEIQYILLFAFLIFYGITESKLIKNIFLADNIHQKETIVDKKHIKRVIEKSFHEEKIYKDCDLTIDKLSIITGIAKPSLRDFINKEGYQSFREYINHYRVEDIKSKMINGEYDNYDLTSLSKLSGFNSKASFYRIFKQTTGITPAQFKRKQGDS